MISSFVTKSLPHAAGHIIASAAIAGAMLLSSTVRAGPERECSCPQVVVVVVIPAPQELKKPDNREQFFEPSHGRPRRAN